MYTQCTHNAHVMYTLCIQCTHNAHIMYRQCIHIMYTQCTHNVNTTYTVYSVYYTECANSLRRDTVKNVDYNN